jgi:hypothetical protein
LLDKTETQEGEKLMKVYEGTLILTRTTTATVVYGNTDLPAQYLPKLMLKKTGKAFPPELIFTIEIPDSTEGRRTK